MRTIWVVALLAAAMLSGCAGDPASTAAPHDDHADHDGGNVTAAPAAPNTDADADNATANVVPTLDARIDRDNGTVPFDVSLVIVGNDEDGDALAWAVFLNGTQVANGTDETGAATINITAVGAHLLEVVLTDGHGNATQSWNITALAPVVTEAAFEPVTLTQDILLACPYCTLGSDLGDSSCVAVVTDDNGLDCAFWPIEEAWVGRTWTADGTFIPVVEFYPTCAGEGIIDYSLDGTGTIPAGTGCIVMYDIIDPVVTAVITIT